MNIKKDLTKEEEKDILYFADRCANRISRVQYNIRDENAECLRNECGKEIIKDFLKVVGELSDIYNVEKEDRALVINFAISSGDASNENIKRLEEYYINGVITDNK